MRDAHKILLKPLITEKTMLDRENFNHFVFKVDPGATKVEIRQAVEKSFSVKVLDVKTINVAGKAKRRGKHTGNRPDWKKAIVKLAPGASIKYFEGA